MPEETAANGWPASSAEAAIEARVALGTTRPAWQRALADAISSLDALLDLLELGPDNLDPELLGAIGPSATGFPLRVPRSYAARMRPGDPRDPLLLQVLPTRAELEPAPGFTRDPLAEADASPTAGLLHKYHGRVLLVATGACAIHCRYCFRRHFPYGEHQPWGEDWADVLRYVAETPSASEVILSGGDPLALSDARLSRLARSLSAIPHVRRLRVHSRLPVVLPERVDDDLLAWLGAPGAPSKVVVIHANHPRELSPGVVAACVRLREAGVTLLNQTVLLAGINDDTSTLAELSEALFECGVLPYYLHVLDRVEGTAHFLVDDATARRLAGELTARLPGYLVPRLVREEAGAVAKVPLLPRLPSTAD